MIVFEPTLTKFFMVLILLTLLTAGFLDFLYYRLPNKIFYFLFYSYAIYILLSGQWHLWINYVLFLAVMVAGFALFFLKIVGGGDVKILAASLLWVGVQDALAYMLLVTALGAILGLQYLWAPNLMLYFTTRGRWLVGRFIFIQRIVTYFVPEALSMENEVLQLQNQKMIPYGAAIACSAFLILGHRLV